MINLTSLTVLFRSVLFRSRTAYSVVIALFSRYEACTYYLFFCSRELFFVSMINIDFIFSIDFTFYDMANSTAQFCTCVWHSCNVRADTLLCNVAQPFEWSHAYLTICRNKCSTVKESLRAIPMVMPIIYCIRPMTSANLNVV